MIVNTAFFTHALIVQMNELRGYAELAAIFAMDPRRLHHYLLAYDGTSLLHYHLNEVVTGDFTPYRFTPFDPTDVDRFAVITRELLTMRQMQVDGREPQADDYEIESRFIAVNEDMNVWGDPPDA